MAKTRTVVLVALFLLFSLGLQSCDWPARFGINEPTQLYQKSPHLVLAWNPPITDLPKTPLEVVSYQIFYRQHGDLLWSALDEVPASAKPRYTVKVGQLQDGLYDFAVRAVSANGHVSPLHSSLDESADPISGWFVLWINGQ
jgi:hypothetical protein